MGEKLTKKLVEALEVKEKERFVFDEDVPALAVRIYPTGKKLWMVRYTFQGKVKKVTLGDCRAIHPENARNMALDILSKARNGTDTAAEKKAARAAAEVEKNAPTMADLWARYGEEHLPTKKAKSQQNDQLLWRKHIVPRLGETKIADVSRSDILRLQREITKSVTANRAIALLSKMLNLAEEDGWEYRPRNSNPCFRLKRSKEKVRHRALSPDELARLGKALETMVGEVGWQCIALVRLLLLTGCRLNEILTLQWDWIDWHRSFIAMPDSKTGQKNVLMTPDVEAVLKGLPTLNDSHYVLPGRVKGKHYSNPHRPFEKIIQHAGISDLRLHDLRHTFASYIAMGGHSQATIARLLHHKQISTSERYTNLMDSAQRAAAQQATEQLTALMLGGTKLCIVGS